MLYHYCLPFPGPTLPKRCFFTRKNVRKSTSISAQGQFLLSQQEGSLVTPNGKGCRSPHCTLNTLHKVWSRLNCPGVYNWETCVGGTCHTSCLKLKQIQSLLHQMWFIYLCSSLNSTEGYLLQLPDLGWMWAQSQHSLWNGLT